MGIERSLRFTFFEGMDIGKNNDDPVSLSYKAKAPVALTGKIQKVTIETK